MKTDYKIGDSVNITSQLMQSLYNIQPSQKFKVKKVIENGVILDNNWEISFAWVKPAENNHNNDSELKNVSPETLEEYIIDVVDDFVLQNLAFTIYDVTKEVRKRHPEINVPHKEVRSSVEYLYNNQDDVAVFDTGEDYTKTLVKLPSVAIEPWLYHPISYDPAEYKPNIGPQSSNVKPPIVDSDHTQLKTPTKSKFVIVFGNPK